MRKHNPDLQVKSLVFHPVDVRQHRIPALRHGDKRRDGGGGHGVGRRGGDGAQAGRPSRGTSGGLDDSCSAGDEEDQQAHHQGGHLLLPTPQVQVCYSGSFHTELKKKKFLDSGPFVELISGLLGNSGLGTVYIKLLPVSSLLMAVERDVMVSGGGTNLLLR